MKGRYEQQFTINKNDIIVEGQGQKTLLISPTTLNATVGAYRPVITVSNSTGVVIRDLKLDGAGRGNGNSRFVVMTEGIFHSQVRPARQLSPSVIRSAPPDLSGLNLR